MAVSAIALLDKDGTPFSQLAATNADGQKVAAFAPWLWSGGTPTEITASNPWPITPGTGVTFTLNTRHEAATTPLAIRPSSGTVFLDAFPATQSGSWTVAATQSGAWAVGQSGAWNVSQAGTWSVGQSGAWNVNASQTGTWNVNAVQSGVWSVSPSSTWTVNAVQSGGWAVGQSGAWTVAATQSGTWNVNQAGTWNTNAVQSGSWTVAATQSGTWNVGQTGTWNVNAVQSGNWAVGQSGSWNVGITQPTLSHARFTALSNADQQVKSTAGNVYGFYLDNPNTTSVYVKFYDATTANTTVGTTTPKRIFRVPAMGILYVQPDAVPAFVCDAAISVACVTGIADNSTTAPTTGVYVAVDYA